MTISPIEAAGSLRLAERAAARSETLRGYQSAAPHLLLWGGFYVLGYATSQFAPHDASAAWIALTLAGTVGSTVAGFRDRSWDAAPRRWAAIPALMLLFLVLVIGTALIMRPTDPRQMGAFIPLLVSAAYVVLGLGAGSRLVVAGLALAAATFIGFFALPHWFFLWMAVCGGATLIGSGLWLRRV